MQLKRIHVISTAIVAFTIGAIGFAAETKNGTVVEREGTSSASELALPEASRGHEKQPGNTNQSGESQIAVTARDTSQSGGMEPMERRKGKKTVVVPDSD